MGAKFLYKVSVLCLLGVVSAQDGVKTWRKGGGGGSMVSNHTLVDQTLGGGDHPTYVNHTMMNLHRSNESVSAFDKFMNRTVAQIPKGICTEEVPTVSLLQHNHRGDVPVGNGSDPSRSRIQVCCPGYERNVHNFRKCDPICEQPCVNSLCIAPNTCECYPDFVKNHKGNCVPTCPIGCDHGQCSRDLGTCVCDEGYELDVSKLFCLPKCTGGCGAGRCVATEKCECDKGYEYDRLAKCAPSCQNGCANGRCVAPDICQCDPGYEISDIGCEPICSDGCFHGVCTAPEVCSCKPGYQMIHGQCSATCDRPCTNGECTGPNICSCSRGYILDDTNPFRCLPHCPNGCPNGVCSGPNMCLCNAGFIKDRSLKGSQACIKRV